MVTCSVSGCGYNQNNKPENYSFHRFPLDSVTRGKWLKLIGRVGWNPSKYSTICSKHFPDHYKMKRKLRTILLKGALPTVFVPGHLTERVPSSYIYRDIPSTSQELEISVPLTPRQKKLELRISSLKQKLRKKQKKIRSLLARTKRQALKIVLLQDVLKKIHSRQALKDRYSDITIASNNEFVPIEFSQQS